MPPFDSMPSVMDLSLCRSDDEEDLGQKTERDLYDEDDSVLDLDYGDGSRGNVHIPKEDSHHAERVPVLVDKASDSRCEI